MTSALERLDPEMAKRLALLAQQSDQRPSGSGMIPTYEISRAGGWENVTDESDRQPTIRLVPLLLRETRAYWTKKQATGEAATPPDCKSNDGLKPVQSDDLAPQAEECHSCPWNKFNTAEQGKGKKCKTKGVLFGLRLDKDGNIMGPVVMRFSLANKDVSTAIAAADRRSAESMVPRILSVWEVGVGVGKNKGGTDYTFAKPAFSGKVPENVIGSVLEQGEGLVNGGADEYLDGAGD